MFNLRNKLNNFLCYFMLFISCINMISFNFFNTYKAYLIIFFIMCNIILIIFNFNKIIKKEVYLFSVFSIVIILYSCMVGFIGNFNYIEIATVSLIINLFLTLIVFNVLILNLKSINRILNVLAIYSIVFLFLHWHNTLYNLNTISTFSFPLLIYCILWCNLHNVSNFFQLLIGIIFFAFAVHNECRSVIIGETIFFILIMTERVWLKKIFFNIMVLFVILGGIFFPYLWISIWESGYYFKIPFTSKGLYTGREAVWSEFFYRFTQTPILGTREGVLQIPLADYNDFTPHNFMFNILCVYGVIIFIIFIIFLIRVLNSKRSIAILSKPSRTILCGIFGILITSFFETIPLSYIHVIMIWFLLVTINSLGEENKNGYKTNVKECCS